MLTAEKEEGIFFIVMEYVPGETLEAIIMREGALDVSRALDYTCQICNALDHAPRPERDPPRPAARATCSSPSRASLKVADFGTSRVLEIAAHGTTVIGSPPYMAPEQFHGKAVFASDIYSLGVSMYQMLTGMLPYETPAPGDIDRLMTGELVSPPRVRNPKIPKAVSDVILKAMAPEIAARYQRAGELLDDLLAARAAPVRRVSRAAIAAGAAPDRPADMHHRIKAREQPQARLCWHCNKPLHARSNALSVLRREAMTATGPAVGPDAGSGKAADIRRVRCPLSVMQCAFSPSPC